MQRPSLQLSSELDFSPYVRADDVVTWPQGTGEPLGLTSRLMKSRHSLPHLQIFAGNTESDTLRPEYADRFRFRTTSGSGTTRRLTAANLSDIVPCYVSRIPGLVRSGTIRVDVVLLRVRPHPKPGYFTTGVIADFVSAYVAAARWVIAEIDERLPVTSHDTLVAADDIDLLTECDAGEVLMPDPEPGEVEMQIAQLVAELVPDGATIELGVGKLPAAICHALGNHRDLGVHSGVIPDVIADLIEKGVVTNARKGIDEGRTVTGGLFGSRRLMDFADGNETVEMRSSDYTHAPQVLARLQNFRAINSCIEVDLTGSANSEVAGGRYLGAIGGLPDFVRGAAISPGGRSILALASTTPDGKHSRIVTSLEGRPASVPKGDADLVVTEYGVADLRGRSLSERAERLRAIAHPNFRDRL